MPDFAERLAGLRRSIELDRFGIAAHVLSSRDGCTAERCPAFALLRDTSALKANLRVRAYNEYVARHATAWNSARRAGGEAAAGRQRRPAAAIVARRRQPAGTAGEPDQSGAEPIRFPLGRLDPAGQHHERRAAAAGGGRCRQCRRAAR